MAIGHVRNLNHCILIVSVCVCWSAAVDITVLTNVGNITGSVEDVNVGPNVVKVSTYLGIPFAEPPVGNLRFTKPQPKIWIHGGSFSVGSGRATTSSILAAYGEVIVVSVNYRLGVFGFLTSGNSAAGGNYGLWDQHLAIKWVKNNIEGFGGDATRITIFGESAGSVSVMLQALYPGNENMFQRVIAESA
ncbi:bile salt-activated lipase-like [Patella vulgata]|uniref:bile salt-activated lipase-like n=1 Tax=Patella vulgata TaxID=6465 RepID=UPI0024A8B4DE|nr:bile salt-activated lipase-like [Patella vulgata]